MEHKSFLLAGLVGLVVISSGCINNEPNLSIQAQDSNLGVQNSTDLTVSVTKKDFNSSRFTLAFKQSPNQTYQVLRNGNRVEEYNFEMGGDETTRSFDVARTIAYGDQATLDVAIYEGYSIPPDEEALDATSSTITMESQR